MSSMLEPRVIYKKLNMSLGEKNYEKERPSYPMDQSRFGVSSESHIRNGVHLNSKQT